MDNSFEKIQIQIVTVGWGGWTQNVDNKAKIELKASLLKAETRRIQVPTKTRKKIEQIKI